MIVTDINQLNRAYGQNIHIANKAAPGVYPATIRLTSLRGDVLADIGCDTDAKNLSGAASLFHALVSGVQKGRNRVKQTGDTGNLLVAATLKTADTAQTFVTDAVNLAGLRVIQQHAMAALQAFRKTLRAPDLSANIRAQIKYDLPGTATPDYPTTAEEAAELSVSDIEFLTTQTAGSESVALASTVDLTSIAAGKLFKLWITTDSSSYAGESLLVSTIISAAAAAEHKARADKRVLPVQVAGTLFGGGPNVFALVDVNTPAGFGMLEDAVGNALYRLPS